MQPFGFAPPVAFRGQEMAQRARATIPTAPLTMPNPLGQGAAPAQLPPLPGAAPAAPTASVSPMPSPSAASRIPDMAPITAPAMPGGDASSGIGLNTAEDATAGAGADMNIGDILSLVFGA